MESLDFFSQSLRLIKRKILNIFSVLLNFYYVKTMLYLQKRKKERSMEGGKERGRKREKEQDILFPVLGKDL